MHGFLSEGGAAGGNSGCSSGLLHSPCSRTAPPPNPGRAATRVKPLCAPIAAFTVGRARFTAEGPAGRGRLWGRFTAAARPFATAGGSGGHGRGGAAQLPGEARAFGGGRGGMLVVVVIPRPAGLMGVVVQRSPRRLSGRPVGLPATRRGGGEGEGESRRGPGIAWWSPVHGQPRKVGRGLPPPRRPRHLKGWGAQDSGRDL